MLRAALVAVLAAAVVALIATADHRHKGKVENAAQEDAWYCAHGRPSACTDFDEVAYEAHWERKETAYRMTFFALGATALGLTAVGLRRRHG
jgi:uncharacterized membrane protein